MSASIHSIQINSNSGGHCYDFKEVAAAAVPVRGWSVHAHVTSFLATTGKGTQVKVQCMRLLVQALLSQNGHIVYINRYSSTMLVLHCFLELNATSCNNMHNSLLK